MIGRNVGGKGHAIVMAHYKPRYRWRIPFARVGNRCDSSAAASPQLTDQSPLFLD